MKVLDGTSDFSAETRYDSRVVAFALKPLDTSLAVELAVEIALRSNTLDPLEVGNPAAAGDLLREFDNATQGADRIEILWVWIHEYPIATRKNRHRIVSTRLHSRVDRRTASLRRKEEGAVHSRKEHGAKDADNRQRGKLH